MIHVVIHMLKAHLVREGVQGRYDLEDGKAYTVPLEEAEVLIEAEMAAPLSVVCTDDDGKVPFLAQTTLEGLNFIVAGLERARTARDAAVAFTESTPTNEE